jgi:hypothetical protein
MYGNASAKISAFKSGGISAKVGTALVIVNRNPIHQTISAEVHDALEPQEIN